MNLTIKNRINSLKEMEFILKTEYANKISSECKKIIINEVNNYKGKYLTKLELVNLFLEYFIKQKQFVFVSHNDWYKNREFWLRVSEDYRKRNFTDDEGNLYITNKTCECNSCQNKYIGNWQHEDIIWYYFNFSFNDYFEIQKMIVECNLENLNGNVFKLEWTHLNIPFNNLFKKYIKNEAQELAEFDYENKINERKNLENIAKNKIFDQLIDNALFIGEVFSEDVNNYFFNELNNIFINEYNYYINYFKKMNQNENKGFRRCVVCLYCNYDTSKPETQYICYECVKDNKQNEIDFGDGD